MSNDDSLFILNDNKPQRADAARNRRKLMEVAQTLFNEQGVANVTMSEIAQSASVGKGTLYRHFSDKATLCHAMLDEAMRNFQQATLLYLRNSDNPANALRWFLGEAVAYVDEHIELLREAATAGDTPYLEHPAHIWFRQTIFSLLQRIGVQGDLDYMTDTLYVMLDVRTIRFQRQMRGYERERIVDGIHTLADALMA
jgi:AcrR family transcriptional regulator